MIAQLETGGPAFPEPGLSGLPNGEFIYGQGGMTLRDYFAAKAMQGLMGRTWDVQKLSPDELFDRWATSAYMAADAMIKARNA